MIANSRYCVVDEAGQIQLEQLVRTSAKRLHEVFGAMPRSRIAPEVGAHSPWISRLLREFISLSASLCSLLFSSIPFY